MSEWQPIETAPKDGTEVWAYCAGEQARMYFCTWIDEFEYEHGAWVWADSLLSDADPCPECPTHWMPLPDAPK